MYILKKKKRFKEKGSENVFSKEHIAFGWKRIDFYYLRKKYFWFNISQNRAAACTPGFIHQSKKSGLAMKDVSLTSLQ